MVGAMHEPQHPKSHEPNPSEGVPEPSYFQVLENGSREKITAPAPYPHGNGCWRMKASDLILFGKAIRRHSLITEQSQRAMLDHRPSIGFMAFDRGSVKSWGHPGGWMGQSGFLHVWLTDPPITAVVLSENSTTPETMQPFLDKEFNQ